MRGSDDRRPRGHYLAEARHSKAEPGARQSGPKPAWITVQHRAKVRSAKGARPRETTRKGKP